MYGILRFAWPRWLENMTIYFPSGGEKL